jgi:hypothetical protein
MMRFSILQGHRTPARRRKIEARNEHAGNEATTERRPPELSKESFGFLEETFVQWTVVVAD